MTSARSAGMVAVRDHPPHLNSQRTQMATGRVPAQGHPPTNPSQGETWHANHTAPHPGSLSGTVKTLCQSSHELLAAHFIASILPCGEDREMRLPLELLTGCSPHLPAHTFFWQTTQHMGILVPRPGIEPVPPAVEARSPNHWSTTEVPNWVH